MAKGGDFRGHRRGPQMAITEDFFVATDTRALGEKAQNHFVTCINVRPRQLVST